MYGFGGRISPRDLETSHCFAVNGDIFNPECNGLEEVLEAYSNSLKHVKLHGPTNFAEVIKEINDRCDAIEIS